MGQVVGKENIRVKRRNWIVLAVLVVAMFALSGCGVPMEGVDVVNTQPEGPWQTFVVWPLANILIGIDGWLAGLGVVYHWGWAIIVFTLLVKLITFPLTLQQTKSMQAQKDLQPRLQELQKKYGKDREKLAAEQMKLYQEAGVNPLSGCFPLLIQMPILFGLYAALVAVGPMLENAGFFWIPDLSYPQYTMGMGWIQTLWQEGQYALLAAYLVLPVMLIVTQFIMQKWMTPTPVGANDGAAKSTQNMTLIMTLMFGFFTLQVPAGLTLYWVTSNLLQMLQQWAVTTFFTKPSPAAAAAGGGAVVVDSKATKAAPANNGAGSNASANPGANPTSAGATRPAASGAPSSAKSGKPSNRPKAKGK
jgi:YidC/Oxa1 family membrane protein insertase